MSAHYWASAFHRPREVVHDYLRQMEFIANTEGAHQVIYVGGFCGHDHPLHDLLFTHSGCPTVCRPPGPYHLV